MQCRTPTAACRLVDERDQERELAGQRDPRRDRGRNRPGDVPSVAPARRRALDRSRSAVRLAAEPHAQAGSVPMRAGPALPSKAPPMSALDPRAEGLVRLHRAQLLPVPALLGLGDRVPRLLRRRRAVDLADRRAGRRSPPAPDPDGRRDLLELPVGGVQLDRRDDPDRALGGHARVHDDGARSADRPTSSAAVAYAMVFGLDPHRRDPRRDGRVLPGPVLRAARTS